MLDSIAEAAAFLFLEAVKDVIIHVSDANYRAEAQGISFRSDIRLNPKEIQLFANAYFLIQEK